MGELERKAIEHFGKKNQIIKTIEELGELQTALARYLLYKDECYHDDVVEEICDCVIMIEQLKELFDISFRLESKREMLASIISGEILYRRN